MNVTPDRFGRDHESTMLYIETLCTDHRGVPTLSRMRTHFARHPQYAVGFARGQVDGTPYPTRLANGETAADHDDWDCADDLQAAGLIEILGTGINRAFAMTDAGRAYAGELRTRRQKRALVNS